MWDLGGLRRSQEHQAPVQIKWIQKTRYHRDGRGGNQSPRDPQTSIPLPCMHAMWALGSLPHDSLEGSDKLRAWGPLPSESEGEAFPGRQPGMSWIQSLLKCNLALTT